MTLLTDRQSNILVAVLATLFGVMAIVIAAMGGGLPWWLGAAAAAVVVGQSVRRLRSGSARGVRSDNGSAG